MYEFLIQYIRLYIKEIYTKKKKKNLKKKKKKKKEVKFSHI